MKKLILKLYRQLALSGLKNFNKPSDAQVWYEFLESLPPASTSQQRSLNKYFCRLYYFGFFRRLVFQLGSIGGILTTVIPGFLRKQIPTHTEEADAVLVETKIDYKDILPTELLERYPQMKIVKDERERLRLSREARSFFLRIWRKNLLRPYYVLWIYRELAFFSQLYEKYRPNSIIVYVYERSVASPIITEYLETKGSKFISFMHGDYTLQLIHSYTQFSEFYVWDDHYIETLSGHLKCPADQFRVYRPNKLLKEFSTEHEPVYITYYLGSESDLTLERLGKLFRELKKKGLVCQVRRHPRRQNYQQIAKHFEEDQIQDPQVVSIELSITQSEYIASLNSTVMSEAYYGGKKIVLDDWADPLKYQSYVARRGITTTKYHMLLSELITDVFEGKEI